MSDIHKSKTKADITALTRREREVLRLIAEGLSVVEISKVLYRSEKTIQSHRLSIGRKLGARNRVELTRIAIEAGLVSAHPSQLQGTTAPNGLTGLSTSVGSLEASLQQIAADRQPQLLPFVWSLEQNRRWFAPVTGVLTHLAELAGVSGLWDDLEPITPANRAMVFTTL